MLFNVRQYELLSERYFESLIGGLSTLTWMIGQAPMIAALIILRWRTFQATDTLYFTIALSVVWFGCTNACREFSREKTIYQREALFGLCVRAYVLSKVKILSIIGLTELTLFVVLLNHYLSLDISIIPFFVVTFGLYFSGMSLGLMLSRWTGSSGKAVKRESGIWSSNLL